jgi:hypothetical protein
MSCEAFIQAYSAGLCDLLAEHTGGYQIDMADILISEISEADGLLPMFMLLAHVELCSKTPGLASLCLTYDKNALIDYRVLTVPEKTSLTQMLMMSGELLRSLAKGVPTGTPIVLDGVYKDWHSLMLNDTARFVSDSKP